LEEIETITADKLILAVVKSTPWVSISAWKLFNDPE
jgi:hypothetical protein